MKVNCTTCGMELEPHYSCPNSHHNEITQLKYQLEREQKCVELAVEALENIENDDNSIPETIWNLVQGAIKECKKLRSC